MNMAVINKDRRALKRTEMVHRGSQLLTTAEASIDQALVDTTHLVAGLSAMRLDSNLSAVIGQDAFNALAEAVGLLTKARGATVSAHAHLDDVKTRIGCGAVATGGIYDKGGETPINPPTG